MGGDIPFKDALTARLKLIKPSSQDLANCLAKNPPKLTPSVDKVILQFQKKGVHVYLITGGFRQVSLYVYIYISSVYVIAFLKQVVFLIVSYMKMVHPIAEKLRIPFNRVYANNLIFDGTGNYLGFDYEEYTCKDGGKPAVIQHLKNTHGYSTVVMVGDSVTDMQAKPPADVFIGFGGVNERPAVKAGADWYITDFEVYSS
jgi:phosphoserine phosphatase